MKEGLEKDAKKLENSGVKDVETNVDTGKKKGKEERPPTKVVVRRLPPTMTEEEFLQQIDPIPPVDYMYYVPADTSLSPHSFCRAYLNFINQSDIFIFTQKFDGYVFVDSKGMEYPAVVEFAPFQRIPKQRSGRKKDPKAGTLELDPLYTSFLEKLQAQIQENTSTGSNMKQHFFETNVGASEEKVVTTPLLDFLRARHAERLRAREEKRKKDLERKRARDEQRRSAKKPEEESSVLKVLPSHTNNSKVKDRDLNKPMKKRNEDRIKEMKLKIGKHFAEERQKQLERREEQKKRFAANKTSKSQVDQKLTESADTENTHTGNSKVENQAKSTDSYKKETSYEKKSSYHRHSESLRYDKRDDDTKRRFKEHDRVGKTKDHYRERREDRFNTKKKLTDKKIYDKDDSYKDKYKKNHADDNKISASKEGNEKEKKKDLETPGDSAKTLGSDTSLKETTQVKEENTKIENTKIHEQNKNVVDDMASSCVEEKVDVNKQASVSESIDVNIEICNVKNTFVNRKVERRNSLESGGKNLSFYSQEQSTVEFIKENDVNFIKYRRNSLETALASFQNMKIVQDKTFDSLSFKRNDFDGTDVGNNNASQVDETRTNEVSNNKENEEVEKNDKIALSDDQEIEEVMLKRRNSVELFNSKGDASRETIKTECVRRSSLGSGDKHLNSKLIDKQQKLHEKKADVDCSETTDSKPKDPRTERRIRNKDRPTMEIYRPGMGKFSKQRLEREKVLGSSTEVDSNSPSPSPTLIPKHKSNVTNSQTRDS